MDTKEAELYIKLLIAGLLLGVIVIVFILNMIRLQRHYQRPNRAYINAELNTIEAERKRIAADLHDDLGPVLSTAKRLLQSFVHPSPGSEILKTQAIEYIDSSVSRLGQIAQSLMPNTLLRKGLVFAILEFIDTNKHSGLKMVFDYETIPDIPEDERIQVYRIVQEIIHNAIKHSQGTELHITLVMKEGRLLIHTSDDGCGFDAGAGASHSNDQYSGMGLQIIKRRVYILGGEIQTKSKPGKGAQYFISIPV